MKRKKRPDQGQDARRQGSHRPIYFALLGLALVIVLLFVFLKPGSRKKMNYPASDHSQDYAWSEGTFFHLDGQVLTGERGEERFKSHLNPKAKIYGFPGRLIVLEPDRAQVLSPKDGTLLEEKDWAWERLERVQAGALAYSPDHFVFLDKKLRVQTAQECLGRPTHASVSPTGGSLAWIEVEDPGQEEGQVRGKVPLDPALDRSQDLDLKKGKNLVYSLCVKPESEEKIFSTGPSYEKFFQVQMADEDLAAGLTKEALWIVNLQDQAKLRPIPYFGGLDLAGFNGYFYVLRPGGLDAYDRKGDQVKSWNLDIQEGKFVTWSGDFYILSENKVWKKVEEGFQTAETGPWFALVGAGDEPALVQAGGVRPLEDFFDS